jgi:hypothetical protein
MISEHLVAVLRMEDASRENGIKELFTDRLGENHDHVQVRKLTKQPEEQWSTRVYSKMKKVQSDMDELYKSECTAEYLGSKVKNTGRFEKAPECKNNWN